jgi:predicted NBD/HSP70 family sugar kinase
MDDRRLDRDAIKRVNRNLVLNLVKSAGPLSRRDIVRRSGLSAATVTNLTAELIGEDLVHEMGPGEATRGRPPVLLRLNNRAGFVVGVKVMEEALAAVVTDLDAEVLAYRSDPLPTSDRNTGSRGINPAEVVAAVAEIVELVLGEARVDRSAVLGLGLGLAGVMDSQTGRVVFSPFFSWRDVDLAGPLRRRLGMNVMLENDVNALTIAEQWFGHGHDREHFCVVTVGRGVGLGLVLNGQFYRGVGGGAGELGHTTLMEEGPTCYCGKNGCLEMLASDRAVIRQAGPIVAEGELEAGNLTLAAIVAAADRGVEAARELLAESGHWLGVGIANVVNLLNPGLVIIGGEGVHAGQWRFDPMRQAFEAHVFDGLADNTEFVIEPAGDDTWARGAACVVLGEMFKSPLHKTRGLDLSVSSVRVGA